MKLDGLPVCCCRIGRIESAPDLARPSLNPIGPAASSERKQGHLEAGKRRVCIFFF